MVIKALNHVVMQMLYFVAAVAIISYYIDPYVSI